MSLIAHNIIEDQVRAGGQFSDQAQTDPERAAFLAARCGKLTASRMNDAMDFLKNGNPSAKRNQYIRDILAERLTGLSMWHYVNPAMQWGIDTEKEAIATYYRITGNEVSPGEVIDHPGIDNFAATPDGFVRYSHKVFETTGGLIEVKCPTTTTFIDWKMAGVVPEEHKNQMLAQLACTGRSWVDFFAYDPRIKEEKKRYLLLRFEPTKADILRIEAAAEKFLEELDAMWSQFIES